MEGRWRDPGDGKQLFGDYLTTWIQQRHGLRPRTVELYRWLAEKYILPQLGQLELRRIKAATVRSWHSGLLRDGVSATMTAKAYRLLRAVVTTAVEDEVIIGNPCRIKGGGQEYPEERPVITVPEVFELARRVPARYEAMVLVTTFASLRFGEVTALRRRDVDLETGSISVKAAFVERRGEPPRLSLPKSRASIRTVDLPSQVVEVLRHHMDAYVDADLDAHIFTGPTGAVIRRGNFNKLIRWKDAVADVGAQGLHFHDLRHTGNTLAARVPGTSTRDLMQRMGHDSMRAALIYQHVAQDAQKRIADGLTAQLDGHVLPATASAVARGSHARPPIRTHRSARGSSAQQNRGV